MIRSVFRRGLGIRAEDSGQKMFTSDAEMTFVFEGDWKIFSFSSANSFDEVRDKV